MAMHHGHRNGMNQGIPTSLIASRVLAGPHGELLRDALASPLPRVRAPEDAVTRRGGGDATPGGGARAIGAAMSALLGSRPPGATVPGPGGRPFRVTGARQIAECFRTADPRAVPGIEPVVEAARAMDATSADGAPTAAVLAAALIGEAADQHARGGGFRKLLRESVEALNRARAALADQATPCSRADAVARGVTADPEVAEAVSAAALLAGPYGVLICEPGGTRSIEKPTVRQGLRVPGGHAFPYAADAPGTDAWTARTRLVKPYVLLLDSVTGEGEAFHRLRDHLAAEGSPLLVLRRTTTDGCDPRGGVWSSRGRWRCGVRPRLSASSDQSRRTDAWSRSRVLARWGPTSSSSLPGRSPRRSSTQPTAPTDGTNHACMSAGASPSAPAACSARASRTLLARLWRCPSVWAPRGCRVRQLHDAR
ncbi:hypothetical protein ACFWBH_07660 [Streptomyces sp. NPDC059999]|uniref:hypothetical protein n=1 Tax=Streptomyces sp. NPDC059999 TaxID=3347030 RepID=UPI0036C15B69